jgi:hypothetical protein
VFGSFLSEGQPLNDCLLTAISGLEKVRGLASPKPLDISMFFLIGGDAPALQF